jgi:hypothetical protein
MKHQAAVPRKGEPDDHGGALLTAQTTLGPAPGATACSRPFAVAVALAAAAGRAATAGLAVAASLVILLAASGTAAAAPGDVVWHDFSQRTPGGADAYCALAVTPSGQACAAGVTATTPGAPGDVLVRKYTRGGSVAWRRVWTWPGRSDDVAAAITRDRRGSFVIVGSSGTSWLLLKYSAGGYLQWVRRGRKPSARCSLLAVAVDRAGNVYAAGSATATGGDGRLLLVKHSSAGDLRWRRTIASGAGDAAATCITLGGGDVYVAGQSATETGTSAAITARYSPAGARRWMRAYAGGAEAVTAACIGYADGPVIAGRSAAVDGPPQAFAVRYAADGSQLWTAGYDAAGVTGDRFDAVAATDGGACVTGSRWLDGTQQMLTAAFDARGELTWEAVTPGATGGTAVCRTAGGFCATGGTAAAVAALFSPDGATVGTSVLSPVGHAVFRPAGVRAAGTHYLYVAGSAAADGGTAAMLVRYRP